MSEQIKFCSYCGASIIEGASFCEKCGKKAGKIHIRPQPEVQHSYSGAYTQPTPAYNSPAHPEVTPPSYMPPQPVAVADNNTVSVKKKCKSGKSGLVKGIIISIIIMIVCESFNGLFSYLGITAEDIAANRYVSQIENYKPGEIQSDTYTSDFWDFSFKASDNWKMLPKSSLDKRSDKLIKSLKESAAEELESAGVSDEKLSEKCMDATYCRVEMAAQYMDGDELAGECYFEVYSKISLNDPTFDIYVETLTDTYSESADDVEITDKTLGKNKYKKITYTSKIDGKTVKECVYLRNEGHMLNMINVVYYEGHDEVVKSFEEIAGN